MRPWRISGLFLIFLIGQATCAAVEEKRAINWRHLWGGSHNDGLVVRRDVVRQEDGLAIKLEGAVKDLLNGLNDFLTHLQDGASASDFKTGLQALSEEVDAIFVASGQEQKENETMQVVGNALQGLDQEVPEEFLQNPLKFEAKTLSFGLDLLSALATSIKTRLDEGANLLDEDADENIYDALFAIKLFAQGLLANADAIDSTITYEKQEGKLEEVGDDDDDEDAEDDGDQDEGEEDEEERDLAAGDEKSRSKRKWCVGWDDRRGIRSADNDESRSKREWCVGRKRGTRSADDEESRSKRSWCVGWKRRTRSADGKDSRSKRKWCPYGWDDIGTRTADDEESRSRSRRCLLWNKRGTRSADDEESRSKRKWCVGWKRGTRSADDEESRKKRKWCVGWDDRRGTRSADNGGSRSKRSWCVGWKRGTRSTDDEE